MPEVEFEEEETHDENNIKMDLDDKEENVEEAVYEEDNGDEDDEGNILPVVEKKERQYKKDDIFIKVNQPEPTKPPKKKRVLTEEHKQKLAQAREKALATRRANAQEKKRIKELEKKAKQKKTKELEDYVEKGPTPIIEPPPQIRKVVEREPTLTKKDIEEAQLEAIIKYETLRKARKKKKQEEQEEERKKEETRNAIRKATQPRGNIYQGQQGFWDDMY